MILASSSPTRFQLMKKLGKNFLVISPDIDEESISRQPAHLPQEIAKLKAYKVFSTHPDDIVLAADTMVIIHGKAISKPIDRQDAYRMIRSLCGQTYVLLTGFTLISKKFEINRTVKTTIRFKSLSDQVIWDYIDRFHPLDKAGAYASEDNDQAFYEWVQGSLDNTYGLPTEVLRKLFKQLNIRF